MHVAANPPSTGSANPMIGAILLSVIGGALWVAFGAVLLVSPATLQELWSGARALPWYLQIPTRIVLLPWMLGLAAWQSTWPAAVRVLAVATLAAATAGAFWPRGR